jgi:hypothetical protein
MEKQVSHEQQQARMKTNDVTIPNNTVMITKTSF